MVWTLRQFFHFVALILLTMLLSQPNSFASDVTESEAQLPKVPVFESIASDWWILWDDLTNEEKLQWIQAIQRNYRLATQDLRDTGERRELVKITQNLLSSLQKLVSHENESPEQVKESQLDLTSWLELYKRVNQLESNVLRIQAELRLRKEETDNVSGRLGALIISHRGLPLNSSQRVTNGMSIYATQVNMLHAKEKYSITRSRLKSSKEQWERTAETLELQRESLTSDEAFDQSLKEQRRELTVQMSRVKNIMSALQQRTWSSLQGEQEIVFQLSYHEEKLKQASLSSQLMAIDILFHISQLLQGKPQVFDDNWAQSQKALKAQKKLLDTQLAAYREQVIASGESANEMIYARTQKSVWRYLESNQKLSAEFQAKIRDVDFYLKNYEILTSLREGWLSRLGLNLELWANDLSGSWQKVADYTLFTVREYPVTFWDLISAVIIVVVAILLSSLLKKSLQRIGKQRSISESTIYTVARVLHYVIITTAILIALSTLGIDSTKFALIAGALSVGIGFGLQAIFNNFVSGLILLFERPLRVGDLVELESGVRGRIRAINVRSTQLTTRDNIDILVPNSEFVNFRVINYTFADPLRRIHVPFRVALDTDKELVQQAAMEAADRLSTTQKDLHHAPDLWLKRIGDFSLEFELVVWVNSNKLNDNDGIEANYLWEIDSVLKEYKIEIPIPKRQLFINETKPVNDSKARDETASDFD